MSIQLTPPTAVNPSVSTMLQPGQLPDAVQVPTQEYTKAGTDLNRKITTVRLQKKPKVKESPPVL